MSDKPTTRAGLILSLNSGSSSLKISLYRLSNSSASSKFDPNDSTENPIELILTSSIESITTSPTFSFSSASSSSDIRTAKNEPLQGNVKDHASAFAHFLDYMKKEADIDRDNIVHVCHRIVHGGDYSEPVIINNESYHHIEDLTDLAPLYVVSPSRLPLTDLQPCNTHAHYATSHQTQRRCPFSYQSLHRRAQTREQHRLLRYHIPSGDPSPHIVLRHRPKDCKAQGIPRSHPPIETIDKTDYMIARRV